jgi:class 3 adenylate cyclase
VRPFTSLRRAAAIACLWACGLVQGAAAEVVLDAKARSVDLWPHVRVLADPARTLDVAGAAQARDRFAVPGGGAATLGLDAVPVWLRVPVTVAPGGEGTWVLDFDYPLLQRVDVYWLREGRVAHHVALGNTPPFEARPLQSRTLAAPLELVGSGELLLRVDTQGAKLLPLSLSRMPAFHAHALREQLVQGALGSLALVLLLYSLVQWAALREGLYLKYAFIVACTATFSLHFFGIGEMYLWTDRAWPARHMAGVTALLSTTATALFIDDALRENLHRWLRLALRALAALHLLFALAYCVDLLDTSTVGHVMSVTGIVPGLIGLPGAVAMARRGERVGAWFVASWVAFFISCAIMIGMLRGVIDANAWTMHSFQIGATIDMVIFMRIVMLRTAERLLERRRLRQSFAGYVSPAVMDEILSGRLSPATGGQQRYVCVMFSDIRNYTTRSEGMQPAELLAFLNDYFDKVVAIIHREGGTVVRFMGDGIMAVFGAPQAIENPCAAAFDAARAMLENLAAVNRQLASQELAPIDIGIGLHAGEAIVGHVGARLRHEYGAIGDVTNVAARLESATKEVGYRLVVSEEVASRLGNRPGLARLGPLNLRGHTPVHAHGFEEVRPFATLAPVATTKN